MIPLEKSVSKVFTYIYIPLSFPLLSSNMSPPSVPTSKCAPHGAAQRILLVNRALYFLTSGDCEILFEIFVCSWSLDGLSVALLCNCLSYSLGDSYMKQTIMVQLHVLLQTIIVNQYDLCIGYFSNLEECRKGQYIGLGHACIPVYTKLLFYLHPWYW